MRRHCIGAICFVSMLLGPTITSGQARWRLEVATRIEVDSGPAEPIKDLRDFAVGNDGRVYVLENTVQQVHVYSRDGRFVKSFSRAGSGPGELRRANGIVAAPDGSLWVNDYGNRRFNNYSANGAYLKQMRSNATGSDWRWPGFVDQHGVLYDVWLRAERGNFEHLLQRRKPDGGVVDTLGPLRCPDEAQRKLFFSAQTKNQGSMAAGIPFVQQRVSTFDPRGRGAMWCVPGTGYRIVRVDLQSRQATTQATRAVAPYPVPQAVRDKAIAKMRDDLSKYSERDADFGLVPNNYPFVGAMLVDARGRLWVLREQGDSMRTEFDVFDDRGGFLATAVLPLRTSRYGRFLVRDDHFYAVALDEDDVPSIVRARIVTGAR